MKSPWRYPQLPVVQLEHDYKKLAAKLEGEFPALAHSNQTIDRSTLVLTPGSKITALYLKQCIDVELWQAAFNICATVDDSLEHRPAAVGSESMRRIKKNGRRGSFRVVPDSVMDIYERADVHQGLLGAVGGTSKVRPHLSRLTRERPELLVELRTLIQKADRLYAEFHPSLYAIQRAEVKKAPEFRLWRTAFSSLYIPKNLRSAYHYDGWNLPGAMTVLLPLGEFAGGELILPRWRIAIAFEPGDVLIFDPNQLHGNAPIEGDRASIACYCARNLSGFGK